MVDREFWKEKRVLITGHNGFKGTWLCLWLHLLGAEITGYSLEPPTTPNLYEICNVGELVNSIHGDIRDFKRLKKTIINAQPEIIFHLAAQSLVIQSYKLPIETYSTNVMGTVNLFEAARHCQTIRAIINVTTDKCYENKEILRGYHENDILGGLDPYSNSKACSELVTSCYRSSFFPPQKHNEHGVGLATARAGNVIGGGDWAVDRLVPDIVRALLAEEKIVLRNPAAVRPWQHVLEPLYGYLILAQKLYLNGSQYSEAWNFGPNVKDVKTVEWIVKKILANWPGNVQYEIIPNELFLETSCLKLDCSKAETRLGWKPKWKPETAIIKVIEWILAHCEGRDLRNICLKQIEEHLFS